MKLFLPKVIGLLFITSLAYAQQPSNQPTAFTATTLSSGSILLEWTGSTGATLPASYLIIAKKNVGGNFQTVADGADVTNDYDFTDTDKNGAHNIAHVVGDNEYEWNTGLDPATAYDFRIYAYNGAGATADYRTSSPPAVSATTFAEGPSEQVTGFTATTISSGTIRLSWTGAAGAVLPTQYLIVAKKNVGGTYAVVVDGDDVANDTDFSDANKNGAHNIAHAAGTTNYDWTGLDPNTLYDFQIYAYTGTTTAINFNTTSAPSASAATLATEPSNHPTGFTATAQSPTTIRLQWTGSTGGTLPSHYLIVAKKNAGGAYDAVADGTPVNDDTDFTDANLNGAHNIAHVVGANQYDWTGLDPNTLYDFTIYPYNGANATINFKETGGLTDSETTPSTEPTNYPTGFTASRQAATTIRLSWTGSTGGTLPTSYVIIARKTGGTFPSVADGAATSNDTDFSDVNLNGAHNVAHAVGANQYDWTGLDANSTFEFEIYPYTGSGATADYKTGSAPSASASTLAAEPTNQPTGFNATALSSGSILLEWTGSSGGTLPTSYLIVAKKNTGGTFASVNDGSDVLDDADFTGGGLNGAHNIAHVVGSNQYEWTGLDPQTRYDFQIYAYNGSGATANYNTTSPPADDDYTFALEPASHPAEFDAAATSATAIELSFTAANTIANADGYIILRRQDGADPTATGVTDGVSPGSLSLPSGTTRITTITNAADLTYSNTGLTTGTQYNYAIIPFNYDGTNNATYNYLTAATILVSSETPSSGVTITPANAASVCQGASVTLSTITIAEVGKTDISTSGTIFLELNNLAYSFVPGQGTVTRTPTADGDSDIDNLTYVINASRITITYVLDGNNNHDKESIMLNNIRVTYDGSSASPANIVRVGGTGTINGLNGNLATISAGATAGAPVVSFTPNTYCQGDVVTPRPTVTSNNTNVKWYSDVNLTSEIVGLTAPASPTAGDMTTLGFVTSTGATITRYVTQTPGACRSAGVPVTLTVQPKPVADLVITAGSNTLCRNISNGSNVYENITFTASPSGAATYDFQVNNVSIQNSASRTFTRNSGNLNNGDQVKVIVTVAGSCPSTSNVVTMTINSSGPAVNYEVAFPDATTPATISAFSNQQDTVRLKGVPSGGVFSGPGIVGNYFRPSGLPIGTGYNVQYTITSTEGCTSTRIRALSVYDGTVAIPTLGTAYCSQDGNISITIDSRPGYNLQYIYSPNNYGSNFLPVGSITAANGLDATSVNYPAWLPPNSIWNPGPASSTGGPVFTISPSLISTFNDGTPDGKVTIQFAAAYDFIPPLPALPDGNPDEVRYQMVTFFTRPEPPVVSLSAPGFCTADNIVNNVASVSAVTGATIRWYDNSNLTGERLAISDKSKPTFLELGVVNGVPATYTRYVTQTTNGCQSLPQTVTIVVYSNPSSPTPPSPSSYCAGQPISDLVITASGSVKWYTSLANIPTNPTSVAIPLSAKAAELGVDPNVPATYNRYVTQTINGCESSPATATVTVNPIPSPPPVINANVAFCKNENITTNPPITVTSGTNIQWYRDINRTQLITPVSNEFAAASSELGITSATPNTFQFFITQTSGGCESQPRTTTITINDLTSVSIGVAGDLSAVCKTGDRIRLTATPANGTWSGNGSAALVNVSLDKTSAELDPANANLDAGSTYDLIYTSTGGCVNFDQRTVTMLASINPSITIGDACNGSFVDINNTSVITPLSSSSTISKMSWSFGDGDVISDNSTTTPPLLITDPLPANTNGGNSKGTYQHLEHKFGGVGSFEVRYTMVTSDNCTVTGIQNVQVNPVPNANFVWSNTCEGSGTQFHTIISNPVTIANYNWNFKKDGQLTTSSEGTGADPITTYNSIGRDSVRLIVTSNFNCKDTVQKPVFITPVMPAITDNSGYSQNFNAGSGGWISGGRNSSWEFGVPSSAIINRDSSATGSGNAWKTSLTGNSNVDEQSWVLSPCFDFSNAKKPVISLSIWSETPRGLDGAVLQYNETGNIENNANWKVLGSIAAGVNWYDQNGIAASPGSQPDTDVGWTGDAQGGKYTGWKHAIYKLDELIGKPNIKFRIAFASNLGSREGFAFDNIVISERSRSILIENFTNTSAGTNSKQQNEFFNSFTGLSTEIIGVQYHTSFPGVDPLNQLNQPMNNARTAFYGITSAPALRIDGSFRNGSFANWAASVYDNRVLDPSPLRIEIIPVKTAGDKEVKITTKITNITNAPIQGQTLHLFTIVVEKTITNPTYLGSNGDALFKYVAREILPGPSGILIPEIAPGEIYTSPEVVWSRQNLLDPDNGAIVAFVQTSGLSKEVLQAKLFDNPPVPDLVTGIETLDNAFSIYPNPADKEVTIELPAPVMQHTTLRMYDQLGKVVNEASFERGDSKKTLGTESLSGGVYLIQIDTQKGVLRKKLMVVQRN